MNARGRNIAYDGAIVDPVEDYLVQVWPEADLRSAEVFSSDQRAF